MEELEVFEDEEIEERTEEDIVGVNFDVGVKGRL